MVSVITIYMVYGLQERQPLMEHEPISNVHNFLGVLMVCHFSEAPITCLLPFPAWLGGHGDQPC